MEKNFTEFCKAVEVELNLYKKSDSSEKKNKILDNIGNLAYQYIGKDYLEKAIPLANKKTVNTFGSTVAHLTIIYELLAKYQAYIHENKVELMLVCRHVETYCVLILNAEITGDKSFLNEEYLTMGME